MNITIDQAYDAVESFDAMAFFGNVSGPGRKVIAESLFRLVNTPDGKPLRNKYGVVITVPPIERLARFVSGFLSIPGGWPGIGEMESIYHWHAFPAGDGVERAWPQTGGFTAEDGLNGTQLRLGPTPVEPGQPLLEAGEPMGPEFVAEMALVLAKIRSNA